MFCTDLPQPGQIESLERCINKPLSSQKHPDIPTIFEGPSGPKGPTKKHSDLQVTNGGYFDVPPG